jgi:two-component system chemotaxis sensor kinase CheA
VPISGATAAAPLPANAPSAIRVGVEVLDELLELIGEVVLGRNQLIFSHQGDPAFDGLSRSITRLHQHVIRTRMQNVGSLFAARSATCRSSSARRSRS